MTNWQSFASSSAANTSTTYTLTSPSPNVVTGNTVTLRNGDPGWDGPKNEENISDVRTGAIYRQAFAWSDPKKDPDEKNAHKFIHHVVDAYGNVGAANAHGCRLAIAALNNPRDGLKISGDDRISVFNHLVKHLKDSGVADDDMPKLMSNELLAHLAAANSHESGTNNGPDPMNESQIKTMTAGMAAFVAAGTMPETEDDPGERFIKSLVASGSAWGVQQRGQEWKLFDAEGKEHESFGSYHDATNAIAKQLAVVESRNVLPQPWRSEMTFEGIDTGDGRYIMPGACKFRDCPMPLMLQTETEVGHFGAVLAGTIEQCGMVGQTAVGTGSFDNSEAGNQAVDIINARGRFGVSVDIGESEADFECTLRDPEYDECIDGMVKFTLAEIMGLTMTPFPAFADAYIEIPQQTNVVAASGAPAEGEVECVECEEERTHDAVIKAGLEVMTNHVSAELVAAAAPSAPPAAWFEKPEFKVGDGRLVKQPNGGYACPLTVTPEGQVYGHLAAFKSCHTSYSDRCVPPPRSPSGYAYFTTGAVTTDDGKAVRVGQITMGAGHASTGAKVSLAEVKAHYDGGPGAIQMADVAVGEDEHGIWFSGSLRPDVTEDQIRAFTACGVSGDWREVNRHKGLDLVACAAGIPVPGFPVARALAAAGIPADLDLALPDTRARFFDGEPVALVAAGVVKQPMPWERMIATQQNEIDDLRKRVAAAERVTSQLRGEAAEKLVASLTPATEE